MPAACNKLLYHTNNVPFFLGYRQDGLLYKVRAPPREGARAEGDAREGQGRENKGHVFAQASDVLLERKRE